MAATRDRVTVDLTVVGMDCADCVAHVEHALKELPGVDGTPPAWAVGVLADVLSPTWWEAAKLLRRRPAAR